MKIIETDKLKKLIADEDKQIRDINDIYYKDENGDSMNYIYEA